MNFFLSVALLSSRMFAIDAGADKISKDELLTIISVINGAIKMDNIKYHNKKNKQLRAGIIYMFLEKSDLRSEPENFKYYLQHMKVNNVFSDIINTYLKYNLIVLNKDNLQADELIIGCGHSPVSLKADHTTPIHDPNKHAHGNYLTIDVEMLMNPDIVASIPISMIDGYFKSIKKKFKKIHSEGVIDFIKEVPGFASTVVSIMQDNATYEIHTNSSVEEKKPEKVYTKSEIEELSEQHA